MATGYICANCGRSGDPKRVTKGSFLIELVLWCCLLVPGLIYSIWRLTTRSDACAKCGAQNLVPVQSPRGRQLLAEFPQDDPATKLEIQAEAKASARRGMVWLVAIVALLVMFAVIRCASGP